MLEDVEKGLGEIIAAQFELEEKLGEDEDEERRTKLIFEHIRTFDVEKSYILSEFNKECQWLNTSRALSLHQDFIGKITVLDFFTYCCINCIHILPDLEFIEKEYPQESGVLVVGVHSAKFDNEKSLSNVANAILRHNIKHPVVNDPAGYLWNELQVNSWPTLIVLGPTAQVLFVLPGEGKRNMLQSIIECCLKFYHNKAQMSIGTKLPMQLLCPPKPDDSLLFPSKLVYCHEDGRLAVSDAGHHRIVLVSPDGYVRTVIGGPERGFADGSFDQAKFQLPQGVAWRSDKVLLIADTENHAIRQVCMVTNTVTTLVGNGEQGQDTIGGKFGREQVISSPWDLCIGEWDSEGAGKDILLIAMAGLHQIWGYALENSTLPNGRVMPKGICVRLAGSGREENKNNRYAANAGFAQPSGICIAKTSSGEAKLMVADSESSTIRMIDLKTWAVLGLVGGGLDPLDLFQFGDKDAVGIGARLQHPLGVCWSPTHSVLYVADTYNHKIKSVDLVTKMCDTLAATAVESNFRDGSTQLKAVFNEPAGVCFCSDEDKLYIADTNNNSIKVLHLRTKIVEEFTLTFINIPALKTLDAMLQNFPDGPKKKIPKNKQCVPVPLEDIRAMAGARMTIIINFVMAPGVKMNPEMQSFWQMQISSTTEDKSTDVSCEGHVAPTVQTFKCQTFMPMALTNTTRNLELECTLFVCDVKGRCYRKFALFHARTEISGDAMEVERVAEYTVAVP